MKKAKTEKSFVIVLLVTISYIIMSWACLIIMYKLKNIDSISYVIALCNAVVMTTLTGYFIKARGENIAKIKANPDYLKMAPQVIHSVKHMTVDNLSHFEQLPNDEEFIPYKEEEQGVVG